MAEKREKCFKFIWKVDNFSYCRNETNDFLESPTVALEGSDWYLKLYPNGRTPYENFVSVYLELFSSTEGPEEVTIDYEIALLRPNGAREYAKEMKDRGFRKGSKYGFDTLVHRERLFGAKKSTLLPKDILTLQCCIFPKDTELEAYTEVIARTHLEIERYRLQWKQIDYTRSNSISLADSMFRLSLSIESNNQHEVLTGEFCIDFVEDFKALHGKIGVLDSNNSVVKLLVNDFLDIESASRNSLSVFPLITVPELQENKCLYLPNGKLNLDCEFTLWDGLKHSQIEGIAQDATFIPESVYETASSSQIDVPPKKFLYCIDNVPSSLINDFQNLYEEGTLCDFTIKVGDKNFKVHKAVLGARSPVFKGMLTSNMKENVKHMVDISDLEEDTVHRMLTFMYTDMAGNLDWDTAKKLYFAADKYGLITLKRLCSEVLYDNLSVTNVGEVLALANIHADEYLKKITVEFISDHEKEVLFSTQWKTFMTEYSNLAAETMHKLCMEKAENRH